MSDPSVSFGGLDRIPDPPPVDYGAKGDIPAPPPFEPTTTEQETIPAFDTTESDQTFDLRSISWDDLNNAHQTATDSVSGVQSASPDVTQDAVSISKAELSISKLYDIPLGMIHGNLENASKAIYGEKVSPPNIVQRVVNTVKGIENENRLSELFFKLFTGDESVRPQIDKLQSEAPKPEEMLGIFGKGIFSTLIGMGYQAKAGLEGQLVGQAAMSVGFMMFGPLGAAAGLGSGIAIPVKEQLDHLTGGQYKAMLDAGLDPTASRIAAGALTIGLEALNTLKVGELPGVKQLAEKAMLEGTRRALVSGSFARIAMDFGKREAVATAPQALLSLAGAVYQTTVTEAAKYLESKIDGTTFTHQNFLDIVKGWGLQTASGAVTGALMSAPGMLGENLTVKTAINKLVRAAAPTVLPAETIETKPAKPVYTPPSPGEQKIGDILFSDKQAAQLDAAVKSAESSSDYISGKDLTAKQAVDNYRVKLEARDLTSKYISDIAAVDTSKMRPEYAAPIQDIMSKFTVERFRTNTQARLNDLRNALNEHPEMDLPEDVLYKLGELDKTPLKSLSVDDLGLIHDTIMHYAKLQRDAHEINIAGQIVQKDVAVEKIKSEMKPPAPKPEGEIRAVAGPVVKLRDAVGSLINTVGRRAERFDLVTDRISPTLKKATFEPVNQGWKDTLRYVEDFNTNFQDRLKDVKTAVGSLNKWLSEKETIVLSDKNSVVADRATRLSLYMHAKNEQNRAHVLEGGIGFRNAGAELRNTPIKVSEDALNKIVASVEANPHEKAIVDTARSLLDKLGKDQAALYLELNDVPLKLVENYYRIDTMPVGRGSELQQESINTQAKKQYARIGQFKGQLKARTDSKIAIYINPISADLAVARDHGAAYINLEKPLRNSSRLLYDRTFKDALRNSTGAKTHQILVKALKDVAGQSDPISNTDLMSLKLRNKLSTAYMAAPNLFVPLKQPAAWLRYSSFVRPKFMLQGMVDSIMHPMETERAMVRNSPVYAERSKVGRSREVADILKQGVGSDLGGKIGIIQKLMEPIGFFDTRGSVRPGMRGAVLQAIDEMSSKAPSDILQKATGKDAATLNSLSVEDQVKEAYKFAEWCTEKSQTSSNPLLQSDFQRGTPIEKALTVFASEGFTAANLRRQAFFDAKRAGTPDAWKRFAKVMLVTLVAEPMYEVAVNRLRRQFNGTKQPELSKDALAQVVHSLFAGIPIANQIEQSITNKIVLGWNARSNSLTPIDNVADSVVELINLSTNRSSYTTRKGSAKLAKAVADVTGLISGLPLTPTIRTAEGVSELVSKLGGRK
jgi:hypothetical protein